MAVDQSQDDHDSTSQLLIAWSDGERGALTRLIPLVHRELRELARRQMRRERPGHTLQPTDLLHETYLRLRDQHHARFLHRGQFFAVAATIMRRILVDHARKHRYQKRGGDAVQVSFDDVVIASPAPSIEIIALDEALQKLALCDPRKAAVVEMRYFGGLNVEEIAETLSVSPITIKRDWAFAKAWLYRHIRHDRTNVVDSQ